MASEFDGIPIDVYQGRFNGAFEVEYSDEKHLQLDAEVMIVVRAKCGAANLKSMANGDVRLVRTLKLQEGAIVKNGKLKAYLADQLDLQRDEDPLQVSPGPTEDKPGWEDDEYEAYNQPHGADEDGNFGIIVDDDGEVLLAEPTPGPTPARVREMIEAADKDEEDSWDVDEDDWESIPAPRGPAPGEVRRVGHVAPRDPLVARYLQGEMGD